MGVTSKINDILCSSVSKVDDKLKSIINLFDDNSFCPSIEGSVDTSFVVGGGLNAVTYVITEQTDGKILFGGEFTSYSGVSRNRIIRLNSDGSIDNSFTIGTGFNALVGSIELQPDGKILVGGNFTSYNGSSRNRIIRLNSDGSIDNSFVIGTGFPANGVGVTTMSLQSDGKIVVGGWFNSYSGVTRNRIIRLNSDGSIDNSFVIGTGFNNASIDTILQPDGKIIVGGVFNTYNFSSRNRIVRINSDGSIDNSFAVGTGFSITGSLTLNLQTDGKILVGGDFTSYSGVSRNRIIRLNTDGSIDNSFVIGTGFPLVVNSIQSQPDGKILVGGNFTSYDGVTSNRIIRLNSDGSVDNSFVIGTGFDDQVLDLKLTSNNTVTIVGRFLTYQSLSYIRIIRLIN